MGEKQHIRKMDTDNKWDIIWSIVWWFFALTIVPGGLILAYFGEKDQLGVIMDNNWIKGVIITYGGIGVFCIVYSEVRKRSSSYAMKKVVYTVIACLILFGLLAVTRL